MVPNRGGVNGNCIYLIVQYALTVSDNSNGIYALPISTQTILSNVYRRCFRIANTVGSHTIPVVMSQTSATSEPSLDN